MHNLVIAHFDVVTAFLYALTDRNIYMEQPTFFKHPDYPRDEYVCQLKRSIYGLHQSSFLWPRDVDAKLSQLGFKRSDADESIYVFGTPEQDKYMIVSVYVDDFLVSARNMEHVNNLYQKLSLSYKIRNLGHVQRFLGMTITRSETQSKNKNERKMDIEDNALGTAPRSFSYTIAQNRYALSIVKDFAQE
jgi:Reverse transcriptase (RNA-dependent DNA polymerase)